MTLADDLALPPGRWVPRKGSGGVMEFLPDPVTILAQQPDHRGAVACKCGARETQTCRTKNGNGRKAHPYRELPRVCTCGNVLEPRKQRCADCVTERDRNRKRLWKAANRAA